MGTGLVDHKDLDEMYNKEKYVEQNSHIWDERSENADRWSIPVSSEETDEARKGNWVIILTPEKPVPRDWFPDDMKGISSRTFRRPQACGIT